MGNATRGKGGGGKGKKATKKPGKKLTATNPGGGGGGGTALTTRKAPKIGASYTAFKQGAAALADVTDVALRAAQTRDLQGSLQLKADQIRTNLRDFLTHEAFVAADTALDVAMNQAAALTGGSGTAILPEIYLWMQGVEVALASSASPAARARLVHNALNETNTGYTPTLVRMNIGDPKFRTYRVLKHVGQGIRFLRGKSKLARRLTKGPAALMKMLGGRV